MTSDRRQRTARSSETENRRNGEIRNDRTTEREDRKELQSLRTSELQRNGFCGLRSAVGRTVENAEKRIKIKELIIGKESNCKRERVIGLGPGVAPYTHLPFLTRSQPELSCLLMSRINRDTVLSGRRVKGLKTRRPYDCF